MRRFALGVLAASVTALVIGFGAGTAHACVATGPVDAGGVVCTEPSPAPTRSPSTKPSSKPSAKPNSKPAARASTPPTIKVAQAPLGRTGPIPLPSQPPINQTCPSCDDRSDVPLDSYPFVNPYQSLFQRAVPKPGPDTYMLKIVLALLFAAGGTLWLRQARVRASMIGLDEPSKLARNQGPAPTES